MPPPMTRTSSGPRLSASSWTRRGLLIGKSLARYLLTPFPSGADDCGCKADERSGLRSAERLLVNEWVAEHRDAGPVAGVLWLHRDRYGRHLIVEKPAGFRLNCILKGAGYIARIPEETSKAQTENLARASGRTELID